MKERLFLLFARPLSFFWLILLVCVVGGLVEWLGLKQSPREAFSAALIILGLIIIQSYTMRVPFWPWGKRRGTQDAD